MRRRNEKWTGMEYDKEKANTLSHESRDRQRILEGNMNMQIIKEGGRKEKWRGIRNIEIIWNISGVHLNFSS
jgi:hypothetical protein